MCEDMGFRGALRQVDPGVELSLGFVWVQDSATSFFCKGSSRIQGVSFGGLSFVSEG